MGKKKTLYNTRGYEYLESDAPVVAAPSADAPPSDVFNGEGAPVGVLPIEVPVQVTGPESPMIPWWVYLIIIVVFFALFGIVDWY